MQTIGVRRRLPSATGGLFFFGFEGQRLSFLMRDAEELVPFFFLLSSGRTKRHFLAARFPNSPSIGRHLDPFPFLSPRTIGTASFFFFLQIPRRTSIFFFFSQPWTPITEKLPVMFVCHHGARRDVFFLPVGELEPAAFLFPSAP